MPGVTGLTAYNFNLIRNLSPEVQPVAFRLYDEFENISLYSYIPILTTTAFMCLAACLCAFWLIAIPMADFDVLRLLIVALGCGLAGFRSGIWLAAKLVRRSILSIYLIANERSESQRAFAMLVEKVPMVSELVVSLDIQYLPNLRRPASLDGENP